MGVSEILTQIDHEIALLQKARALLIGSGPAGKAAAPHKPARKKRNLTPEGRRRIAEAVKKRWVEQKKKKAAGK